MWFLAVQTIKNQSGYTKNSPTQPAKLFQFSINVNFTMTCTTIPSIELPQQQSMGQHNTTERRDGRWLVHANRHFSKIYIMYNIYNI